MTKTNSKPRKAGRPALERTTVSVRLDNDQIDTIDRIAQRQRADRSTIIRQFLSIGILEDQRRGIMSLDNAGKAVSP